MNALGAILSIIAGIVAAVVLYMKQKAATTTPEQKAKDDKDKFNDALANGDTDTVNSMLNDLRSGGYIPEDRNHANGTDSKTVPSG